LSFVLTAIQRNTYQRSVEFLNVKPGGIHKVTISLLKVK